MQIFKYNMIIFIEQRVIKLLQGNPFIWTMFDALRLIGLIRGMPIIRVPPVPESHVGYIKSQLAKNVPTK